MALKPKTKYNYFIFNLISFISSSFLVVLLDGSGKLSDASPMGSVGSASEAINELEGLSLEEQEQQRAEWSQVIFN